MDFTISQKSLLLGGVTATHYPQSDGRAQGDDPCHWNTRPHGCESLPQTSGPVRIVSRVPIFSGFACVRPHNIVVIAWDEMDRRLYFCDQLLHACVLPLGTVVGDIPGEDDKVGPQAVDQGDGLRSALPVGFLLRLRLRIGDLYDPERVVGIGRATTGDCTRS